MKKTELKTRCESYVEMMDELKAKCDEICELEEQIEKLKAENAKLSQKARLNELEGCVPEPQDITLIFNF